MPDTERRFNVSGWVTCGKKSNPQVGGVYQVHRVRSDLILWAYWNAEQKRWSCACEGYGDAYRFRYIPSDMRDYEWRSRL